MGFLEVDDLARIEAAGDVHLSPGGELVAYCVSTVDIEGDRGLSQLRLAPTSEEPPRPAPDVTTEGRAPRWSPDSAAIALLRDRGGDVGLLLLSLRDGSVRELASFPRVASPPAWSPAGDRIAVSATIPPSSTSRIAILDAATGSIEVLPGGEDDDLAPSWSPDGTQLAFARAAHDPGESGPASSIFAARVEGGDPVELQSDLAFATCPTWSPDGNSLACYGTREPRLGLQDPALQPWIVAVTGGPARPAAAGINGVIVPQSAEGPIWSGDGSIVFREARAGDINVVRVRADDPEDARSLTQDCQVTSVSASRDGARLAFSACTGVDPGSVYLHEVEAGTQRPAAGRRPEAAMPVPNPVRRGFEGPGGRALDGWVQGLSREVSPQPLLVSMHGGPHNFVGSGFALGHFHRNVLASRGWIVLTLNSSGSGSYGEAFADSIRGRWGERDLPEYLAAADALVAEGLADPARLAVAGYSYGGYLAAWAICHTTRFKAAVIGAPITNLESFRRSSDIGAWYVPWEIGDDAANRERLSPVNHAERIATPTLILHGEADRRCPIAQGEELHDRIADASRATAELVRYPGAEHLFYSQGRPGQRIDYNQRIVEWIESHVLGDTNGTAAVDRHLAGSPEAAQEVRR
jgi:dipeptidyl aminopeptidase/acylaminoacyl peptidase